jgi:hypothetical protein
MQMVRYMSVVEDKTGMRAMVYDKATSSVHLALVISPPSYLGKSTAE